MPNIEAHAPTVYSAARPVEQPLGEENMLNIDQLVTSYPDWRVSFNATLPKGRSPR